MFVGANGTGKTSVLEVLRKIQDLIARGRRVGEAFPVRDLSLGQDRNTQRFGIEACIERQSYRYELTVEHDRNHGRMRISKEVLEHDGRPIFELKMGEAQLYDDNYVPFPNTFPFDWTLSGIGTLYERPNNRKLTRFKREIANYIIVSSCPPVIEPETRSADEFLDPLIGQLCRLVQSLLPGEHGVHRRVVQGAPRITSWLQINQSQAVRRNLARSQGRVRQVIRQYGGIRIRSAFGRSAPLSYSTV